MDTCAGEVHLSLIDIYDRTGAPNKLGCQCRVFVICQDKGGLRITYDICVSRRGMRWIERDPYFPYVQDSKHRRYSHCAWLDQGYNWLFDCTTRCENNVCEAIGHVIHRAVREFIAMSFYCQALRTFAHLF